uniref:NAC domain protein n=2 Tax=Solanum tuberosum TaxID=4113 RepID=M1AGL3_SOLTU
MQDHDIVLCKVYRKATSFKVLEERAMIEEDAAKPYLASAAPHDESQDMLVSLESSSKNDMYFKSCEEENHELLGSNAFVEPPKFSIDSLSSPLWSTGQDLWTLFSLS